MLSFRTVALLTVVATSTAFAQRAAPSAQDLAEVKAKYVKREVRIAMRDGASSSRPSTFRAIRRRQYAILMSRTPYGVAPYGDTAYRASLGPSKRFQDEGFIFVYQDVRGRYMSEGTFAYMTPHIAKKSGPKDIDESTDTYDTIEWLVKNVTPTTTARVGIVGHLVSRLLRLGRDDRRAPGAQGGVAAGADRRLVRRGRLPSQRRALPRARRSTSSRTSIARARARHDRSGPSPLRHGTPDGYQLLPRPRARWRNVDAEATSSGQVAFWNAHASTHPNYDAFWQARNLLPHLKKISAGGAGRSAAGTTPRTCSARWRRTERSRRRTPARTTRSSSARGGTAAGRAATARASARRRPLRLQAPRQYLPRAASSCRSSSATSSRARASRSSPKALVFETGANRWRDFDAWPPKERDREDAVLPRRRAGSRSSRRPTRRRAVRRATSATRARPVPYTTEIVDRHDRQYYMTDDQRFAAPAARRAGVPDATPLTEDVTLAGPLGRRPAGRRRRAPTRTGS